MSILRSLIYVFITLNTFTPSMAGQEIDLSGSNIKDTTRILFVGNSYIYYNNLPEIIAKLAEAGEQATVEYRMVTPGGWRLKDHWEKGEAREFLHKEHWDYVVLRLRQDNCVNSIWGISCG